MDQKTFDHCEKNDAPAIPKHVILNKMSKQTCQ